MKPANCLIPLSLAAVLSLSSCGNLGSLVTEVGTALATDYAGGSGYVEDYDARGVPIFGYDGAQAVYGYDAGGKPIYNIAQLANAVQVPSWQPKAGAVVNYPATARHIHKPSAAVMKNHRHGNMLRGSNRRIEHKPSVSSDSINNINNINHYSKHGRHGKADRADFSKSFADLHKHANKDAASTGFGKFGKKGVHAGGAEALGKHSDKKGKIHALQSDALSRKHNKKPDSADTSDKHSRRSRTAN